MGRGRTEGGGQEKEKLLKKAILSCYANVIKVRQKLNFKPAFLNKRKYL